MKLSARERGLLALVVAAQLAGAPHVSGPGLGGYSQQTAAGLVRKGLLEKGLWGWRSKGQRATGYRVTAAGYAQSKEVA